MGYLIAITGKGGVGKTTVSALLVKQLVASGKTPVLAIDADPNSCLDAALGVKVEKTVGGVREEARQKVQKGMSGITKQEFLQLKIAESLVESEGFDMIAMGRPEGAGCYCYANNVLKSVIAEIADQYPYVVLNNEAGLENLSRRIVARVNLLVIVSDASNSGLETVRRLHMLANEMGIKYDKLLVIINRLWNGLPDKAETIQGGTGAEAVIGLPDDAEVAGFAEQGRSFTGLPDENAVLQMVDKIVKDYIIS
jgi:CO dehydrogenase maturation factor